MPYVSASRTRFDDLGVPEQRLAGDAAPVQAEAADALLLDQHDALAELRGADRGDVAAGPAADDGDVVLSHECTCVQRDRCRSALRRVPDCFSAWYDERTSGPASTCVKPSSRP